MSILMILGTAVYAVIGALFVRYIWWAGSARASGWNIRNIIFLALCFVFWLPMQLFVTSTVIWDIGKKRLEQT